MKEKHTITAQQFLDRLQQFCGTENYYEHRVGPFTKLMLTDGCNWVREHGNAYWLFDFITTQQLHYPIHVERFQIWKLIQQPDASWSIYCSDGDGELIYDTHLLQSDFPISEIKIWVEDGVALLPSEH